MGGEGRVVKQGQCAFQRPAKRGVHHTLPSIRKSVYFKITTADDRRERRCPPGFSFITESVVSLVKRRIFSPDCAVRCDVHVRSYSGIPARGITLTSTTSAGE